MKADRQARIDRAKSVSIEKVLEQRNVKLPCGKKNDRAGPCPRCGGEDRFSINTAKQLFRCRQCNERGGDIIAMVMWLDDCEFDAAITTLVGEPKQQGPNGHEKGGAARLRPTATWIYSDADDKPYLKVERFDKPNGKKDYPQSYWENGRWVSGKPKGPKIPYRLPELLDSDRTEPVYICEGEKCADAVASIGLVATSASEGAGKWTADLNEWFRDRIACILPDKDPQGTKHAELVARNLNGIAREIRIIGLPGLAEREDVYDWIARGGTADQLYDLARATPLWICSEIMSGPHGIEEPPAPDDIKFKLVPFDQLKTSKTSEYVVKGLFPRRGIVVVWGPPKCGKSFWVFDVFMNAAMARYYRGHRVQETETVYFALEGQAGFGNRAEAFRTRYLEPGMSVPLFKLCGASLNLIDEHEQLIAEIRRQSSRPGAAVIDTLNRSLVGSESKDEDMAAYLKAADAIQRAFDCLVVIVHHCGINETRPRGHTSLTGSVEAQIAVKKDDTGIATATLEYAKDMEEGSVIAFKLDVVDLGKDQDGDKITSCVVVPAEGAVAKLTKKGKSMPNGAKIARKALTEAILEVGVKASASNHIPPDTKVVTVEQWRQYAYRMGISDGEDRAKQLAFKRASEYLIANQYTSVWGSSVWNAQ